MLIKKLNQNKRAQQEVGMGTMLLLLLGLAALIVVIIGFTAGWDFLTRWFTDIKPEITVIEQTCNTYITLGGGGYCTNAVDYGKNNYVNCDYAAKSLGATFTEPEKAPTCRDDSAKQICQGIKLREGDDFKTNKTSVNGRTCDILLSVV